MATMRLSEIKIVFNTSAKKDAILNAQCDAIDDIRDSLEELLPQLLERHPELKGVSVDVHF